ncbi:MAG: hypothetical protein JWP40_4778 [Blastococcus sp.]|nr:hypothetical protein [Blastococcus sp.]
MERGEGGREGVVAVGDHPGLVVLTGDSDDGGVASSYLTRRCDDAAGITFAGGGGVPRGEREVGGGGVGCTLEDSRIHITGSVALSRRRPVEVECSV